MPSPSMPCDDAYEENAKPGTVEYSGSFASRFSADARSSANSLSCAS